MRSIGVGTRLNPIQFSLAENPRFDKLSARWLSLSKPAQLLN
jgi:hypothetical protein